MVVGNPLKRGLLFLVVEGNPWRMVGLFLGVEQRAVGNLSRMVVWWVVGNLLTRGLWFVEGCAAEGSPLRMVELLAGGSPCWMGL